MPVQHSSGPSESEKEIAGLQGIRSTSPSTSSTGSIRQHRVGARHVTIKNSIQRLLMPVAMREQFLEEGTAREDDSSRPMSHVRPHIIFTVEYITVIFNLIFIIIKFSGFL